MLSEENLWNRFRISIGRLGLGRLAVMACSLIVAPVAMAEDREAISFKKIVLGERFFSEGASFGDLNRDGKADLVAGPFWFEGPSFEKRNAYYTPAPFDPHGYSDNFFAYVQDFNADGWNDILIYGFPGKDASWFQNPAGKEGPWQRHVVIDTVDNESPTWGDLTGDGKPEAICSVEGYFGYASPDWSAPEKKWTFHRISDQTAGQKFTHGLGFGDVDGDGRTDLLEKTGWWQQPASLEGDPVWKKHPFAFSGPGGAQMYAYDVDGDGRNDVITSLEAHGHGLVWYQQLAGGEGSPKFKAHTILGKEPADNPYGVKFSQIHAIDLVDMDGDGLKDIVTGKRWWAHGPKGDPEPNAPAVIYWFQLRRLADGTVDWVPHLIDDDSGVGVQVVTGDFSGDGLPDVVIGNKKGAFAHIQERRKVSQAEFDALQPRRRQGVLQGGTPEEAAAAMTVPPGFRVLLAAGEPDVCQPIAMAMDDRGRVWVAEAYAYPRRVADEEARDRVLIFEDRDGDGRFDQRTVFYEGLNLVSGLQVGFGGVWVGAAPYLLFIPDRDGDDKPDGKPEVMLDGWAYQDTHETLNSFVWGPDGWLYGCHGVFTHSNVGKPGADDANRTRINAGIWRYHPTRHEFEVFAEGTSNPWGVDFDSHGQAFATACVIPHLYHIIQGGRYQRQAGQHFNPHTYDDIKTIARHRHWVGNQWNNDDRAKSDAIGGGHAHAGAMVYQGGVWPERYHDQLFMNNIHGARLNQDRLWREKSGYVGDAAPDFCFANDRWSQILYMTYGPDGNVTMIDWYDRNECHHGNVEGHDRGNGRIFKIVYGDQKKVEVNLGSLDDSQLIDLQQHPNAWYARHACRILQERSLDSKRDQTANHEKLRAQLAQAADTPSRLRSLWALFATGGLSAPAFAELFRHEDPVVKGWAIRLATDRPEAIDPATIDAIVALAGDASPVVRLHVASALDRLSKRDGDGELLDQRWAMARGLAAHGEDAEDHNLPLLVWYGVEPLVMKDPKAAMGLATGGKIPLVSRFIVRRLAAEESGYEALLAALGGVDEATQLWVLEEVVASLKSRANLPAPPAWQRTFELLMASPNPTIRQQAEYVAVKFGDERVMPGLRKTLADRELPLERRQLALDSLLAGKDRPLPGLLQGLLDDPELRLAAINGLAGYDDPKTPAALISAYDKLPEPARQAAIGTLTARAPYVLALLDAIADKKVPRGDLNAFTVRQIANSRDKDVLRRLNEVWGTIRETPAEKTELIAKYRRQLRPEALAGADHQHGREVYNRTCGSCHVLFESGKAIGPDLTGSNRGNLDYLLENVFDPSAVVGKDYQMTQVLTTGGRAIVGLLKEENDTAITLQTPTDLVTIPKDEIERRELSPLSLMPEGQFDQLPPEDVRDLVAYLNSPAQVPLPGEGPWLNPRTGKVAGAMEGETLKVSRATTGRAEPQGMGSFKASRWSGDSQLWWTGGKPKERLEIEFNVPEAGSYEVWVVATKAIDYGSFSLAVNEGPATSPIDFFNDGVVTTPPISIGVHSLAAGANRLIVTCDGANPKAVKGFMFGLDYIYLAPKLAIAKREP